ncbi:INO80 complex subunit C isoform X1 [Scleropages formosus]|uniref:INO80 complex subunit C n=1 Tax=Scleropages formosus TaxID=113540 RepID=A0A8D0CL30_SCLFO|nr:INO80 complex subunit C isoform X1 [Scleropages formosus]
MASPLPSSGALAVPDTSGSKTAACSAQPRAKKRPASPALSGSPATTVASASSAAVVVAAVAGGGAGGVSAVTVVTKKKKPNAALLALPTQSQAQGVDTATELRTACSSDLSAAIESSTAPKPQPFKDPNFVHSGIGGAAAGKKNRAWKNLKQILAVERALPWQLSDPTYYSIDAPPSLKPAKKYSDISGLPASYTDPQTKLRFASSEEFAYIRLLPTDVVAGYLALRKASCVVP